MNNLTTAIAAGGELPALVRGLKEREQRRRGLQRALADCHTPALSSPNKRAISAEMRTRIAECGTKLVAGTSEGRAMLRLLVIGRLELQPTPRGYRFSGAGTIQPLLFHLKWRPHRDVGVTVSLPVIAIRGIVRAA